MRKKNIREEIPARRRIGRSCKAWKYMRDVNSVSMEDLNRTAVEDGSRKYTYGLMFREWERYASVFSALGMTGEKSSRTGILGSTCAEVIFAFYGLNMTGADVSVIPSYSAFTPGRIKETIRNEKLTDFIITDDFAQPNLINELVIKRNELGLNNIIVLHVPVTGVCVDPMLNAAQEYKYNYMKNWVGQICMDELLKLYGDHPVSYASDESCDTAFILHTSGTTSGAGKPVALSDKAFNEAAACFYSMEELELPWDDLVTAVIVDLSNAYSMIDQVHVAFAMGAKVVMVPGGILNPFFYRAIPKYRISFLFTVSAMFERWMKMPDNSSLNFSSLRFVVLGGASVSASDKKRYLDFMQRHGAGEITLLNGYGITELGGACCLSTPDISDEAIGYPLPGVNVRLLDEESGKFLSAEDAPCEGVLYLNSPALATPVLDGREILKVERTGGKPYICTNDLMSIDADGKLTFLGRANRYFINDEGRKYESGRVETEFARQAGIESCCVVPVYIKTTHDNIPMLCVKTLGGDVPEEVIRKALRQVFAVEKTLTPDNIPSRVMAAKELPRNGNGKIDLYKISRGEVEGAVYTVKPIKAAGIITDFRLKPYEEGPADMIQEVFDGISAELKSSLPLKNKASSENKGEYEMKSTKKAFETWNSMNKMGMQWMTNMMTKMWQMNKAQNFNNSFCGEMPDMQKMMDSMKQMNQKAAGMMPDMQKMMDGMKQMNQKAAGMMPDMQTMMPQMQKQMNDMIVCMNQMNQTALDFMQKMFDQNCRMMEQFFDAAQSQAEAKEEAAEEAPKAEKAVAAKKEKAAKAEKTAPKTKKTAKAEDAKKTEKADK